MKLVIVVPMFFPEGYGGAEKQALILAQEMHYLGHSVKILTPVVNKNISGEESTEFGSIVRVHVSSYPNLGGRKIIGFIEWTIKAYKILLKNISPTHIYVFHAKLHSFGPLVFGMVNKVPVFIKLGGGGDASDFFALDSKKFIYGRLIKNIILKNTKKFIANGDQINKDLLSRGVPEKKIKVLNNGVRLMNESVVADSFKRRSMKKFIFSARMVKDKSPEIVFEMAKKILDNGFDISIIFMGDGPEKNRLEVVVPEFYREKIIFLGYVSNVDSILLESDFYISASTREGQSNSLLEAMSAGLIPIVYDTSGVRDIVSDQFGVIVENHSAEHFYTAAVDLLRNKEKLLKMRDLAIKSAHEKSSIKMVARETEKCFLES